MRIDSQASLEIWRLADSLGSDGVAVAHVLIDSLQAEGFLDLPEATAVAALKRQFNGRSDDFQDLCAKALLAARASVKRETDEKARIARELAQASTPVHDTRDPADEPSITDRVLDTVEAVRESWKPREQEDLF